MNVVDENNEFQMKKCKNDIVKFFREQLEAQSQRIASQVGQLNNQQIMDGRLHDLNLRALYRLAQLQGVEVVPDEIINTPF